MRERTTQIDMDYCEACDEAIVFGKMIDHKDFYTRPDVIRKSIQRAYRRSCDRRDNIECLLTLF